MSNYFDLLFIKETIQRHNFFYNKLICGLSEDFPESSVAYCYHWQAEGVWYGFTTAVVRRATRLINAALVCEAGGNIFLGY